MYNLTDPQKNLLQWLVKQVKEDNLAEEFRVSFINDTIIRVEPRRVPLVIPLSFTLNALNALASNHFLRFESYLDLAGLMTHYNCELTQKAYEAIDSNFASSDTSFVKHLTPLADIRNLDEELKTRCLPILGAGSSDPKLWDSAVRTACVILEERIRQVGSISDPKKIGTGLVNEVFADKGTLATKFTIDSERLRT